jgi:acetyl esterase/lipase
LFDRDCVHEFILGGNSLRKCCWVVLSFFGVALLWAGEPNGKAAVRFERDLTYATVAEKPLQLDLALPPNGDGPFPCVVCLHGGGWRSGKRQDLTNLTELLAGKGFVAATVSYRLAPADRFPAQIEDCKAAVRWLRANASKYSINLKKIGVVGFSAGGHLACLLAADDPGASLQGTGPHQDQPSGVQAVVSYFGPTDFTTKNWNQDVEKSFLIPFLGDTFAARPDLYKKASPITYVTKGAPPFLFFHGDKDKLVGLDQSQKMARTLQEVGVSARVVVMEGEGHGWGGAKLSQTLQQTVDFFAEQLKK